MKKPNVLILFSDQQRFDTIGAAGFDHMITPNLDRLASEGCLCRNAHSTNPVCMAARHDLITGLPAKAHGYFENRDNTPIKDYSLPTIPRIFSEEGYRTVAVGKMHFSPPRMHHGFNEMFLMEEIPNCRQDDQYATYLKKEELDNVQNLHGVRPHIYHIPQNAQTDKEHHGSTWVASKSIEWLEENEEHPFFMFCGWIQPHPPWNIPKELDGIYSDKDLPLEYPISRSFPDVAEKSDWHGDFDTKEEKRKIREAYFTAVTMVDKNIGRIIDYLREKGELDNTLIIFTSDHGEMLQDKGYYSKELPYDSSVRVPMILRYPNRFKNGEKRNEFVDLFDVMPTCLDVCDLKYNSDKFSLIGESLCSEENKRDRRYQISSTGSITGKRRWVMCRNDQYKYIYYYNDGAEILFDMINDPMELNNLLDKGKYPKEILDDLKKRAINYEHNWGPDGAVINDAFIKFDSYNYHGSVTGKMHLWSNSQMQYFDNRNKKERGNALIKEMQNALSNIEKSGKQLDEVFNDNSWKEDFITNFEKFGESEDYKKILFKDN